MWAYGVHPKVRLGQAHSCVLVVLLGVLRRALAEVIEGSALGRVRPGRVEFGMCEAEAEELVACGVAVARPGLVTMRASGMPRMSTAKCRFRLPPQSVVWLWEWPL